MRISKLVLSYAAASALSISAFAASPLADAAMKGDKDAVQKLLQQKADVNSKQADGSTALHWAVYRGDFELADALIAAGADVKLSTPDFATPLFLASESGNAAMIQRLLKAGANANERGPLQETVLMLAARTGNVDAIRALLDAKADVNAKEIMRGTTALMWAAEQGHPAAVKLLVERGADVSAISGVAKVATTAYLAPTVRKRATPAGAPSAGGAAGRATPVAGAGAGAANAGRGGQGARGGQGGGQAGGQGNGRSPVAPNPATTEILDPALASQAALAATLAEGGANFFTGANNDKGGGITPLVFAIRQGDLESVKILVEAGANVNQATRYGWSPLLAAIQNRHYKIASHLLDKGADPNIANQGGWTPLYIATDNRNIEGGDYPVRNPDMDHLEIIRKLLDKGANVNQRLCGATSTPQDCNGDSTETRTIFTMQWLTESGATPFLRAAQSGDVPLMKLLLERGANPKISTTLNVTPLMVAAGIGWVEGVTFEWSPEESVEAVKILLDLGLDPNLASAEGRTALMGAAHKGRNEVVQLLVDRGADMAIRDFGSRDTGNGDMFGRTWIALNYAEGLVRVGVQSALPHPEAAVLIRKLMKEKGLDVPAPISSSICITAVCEGPKQ